MANVVGQRQGFGEILVQVQHVGQGARNLRDFDGVREAVAEMVGQAGSEDLGLGLKAAERTGMNHAVAVMHSTATTFGLTRFTVAARRRPPATNCSWVSSSARALAPATRLVARSSDSNVPASVHQPSRKA